VLLGANATGWHDGNVVKVDIWSDVQCPWCYIGKRKFERAVEIFDGDVEVEYHSFELAPDTPVDYAGSTTDYLMNKYGMPAEQVAQMQERVAGIAASVGLDYHLESTQQTNTVKAHELLHLAKKHGLQEPMKERLLKAYFIEGKHVGRIPDLVELAAEVGLDPAEVEVALTSSQYLPDVKADMAQARAYGISGVPFFVIDGKYGISGAQETQTFVDALNEAVTE
jgi:predicted DsbA family dithiol-disulfide isomerase